MVHFTHIFTSERRGCAADSAVLVGSGLCIQLRQVSRWHHRVSKGPCVGWGGCAVCSKPSHITEPVSHGALVLKLCGNANAICGSISQRCTRFLASNTSKRACARACARAHTHTHTCAPPPRTCTHTRPSILVLGVDEVTYTHPCVCTHPLTPVHTRTHMHTHQVLPLLHRGG